MYFETKTPHSWQELKDSCYQGAVYILPPTHSSRFLTQSLHEAYNRANDYHFHEKIHEVKTFDTLLSELQSARKLITPAATSLPLIKYLIDEFNGAQDDEIMADVLRLRAMPHDAHKNGLSPHSTSMHRDTWYANPQSQINIWVPILDVQKGNSFTFLPRYFDTPIANSSDQFDFDEFMNGAGFGASGKHNKVHYPVPCENADDNQAGSFDAVAGSRVIFSASHLHQTVLNETGLSRFSVDFRLVSLPDFKMGRGAPNVDNHSRGDATIDYHKVPKP